MACLHMPPQMHRKCENSMTLRAREVLGGVVIFFGLVFDWREPEHAADGLDSVCGDSFSRDARQASLLAFLPRKLCRELDAQLSLLLIVEVTNPCVLAARDKTSIPLSFA